MVKHLDIHLKENRVCSYLYHVHKVKILNVQGSKKFYRKGKKTGGRESAVTGEWPDYSMNCKTVQHGDSGNAWTNYGCYTSNNAVPPLEITSPVDLKRFFTRHGWRKNVQFRKVCKSHFVT